jgi:hypothetical protein
MSERVAQRGKLGQTLTVGISESFISARAN